MSKYICAQDLYLDNYDANGFLIENSYLRIPKDSMWEEDEETIKFIGGKDSIHLDRIWKSKKTKTYQWIEIDKTTLLAYFKPLVEKVGAI